MATLNTTHIRQSTFSRVVYHLTCTNPDGSICWQQIYTATTPEKQAEMNRLVEDHFLRIHIRPTLEHIADDHHGQPDIYKPRPNSLAPTHNPLRPRYRNEL